MSVSFESDIKGCDIYPHENNPCKSSEPIRSSYELVTAHEIRSIASDHLIELRADERILNDKKSFQLKMKEIDKRLAIIFVVNLNDRGRVLQPPSEVTHLITNTKVYENDLAVRDKTSKAFDMIIQSKDYGKNGEVNRYRNYQL